MLDLLEQVSDLALLGHWTLILSDIANNGEFILHDNVNLKNTTHEVKKNVGLIVVVFPTLFVFPV